MSENQTEPAWLPFVAIIICIVTFAAIFFGLKEANDFKLIPLIAITAVSGSIVATLLNAIAQAIINATLKMTRELRSKKSEAAQAKEDERTNDINH